MIHHILNLLLLKLFGDVVLRSDTAKIAIIPVAFERDIGVSYVVLIIK